MFFINLGVSFIGVYDVTLQHSAIFKFRVISQFADNGRPDSELAAGPCHTLSTRLIPAGASEGMVESERERRNKGSSHKTMRLQTVPSLLTPPPPPHTHTHSLSPRCINAEHKRVSSNAGLGYSAMGTEDYCTWAVCRFWFPLDELYIIKYGWCVADVE
jgi:hypothetical protein